ncbi:restriction endonuclease subunit S [Methanobrevibacter smithii]|uniref:restriction endonuclease subunit S n=1 Tax=Methanobrevibacter smithii TaxID=2173 RepID=UPI0037DCEDED
MSFSRNTFTNIFGEISSEFNVYTIEDIASDEKRSIISGPFGSNISSKYFTEHGVPVIRGNNLTEDNTKFIDGGFVFVSEEKAKELNTYADVDDLVFTAAGTIGQVGIIPKNSKFDRYIISNKQLRVTLDLNKVNQHYAYYWFSSKLINKYIKQLNTGSTIPLINLSILKGLPIPLPSKDLQDKIANIIINIDKKIETNERINKNLEEQLLRIFDSWFLKFELSNEFSDSKLGLIPKGWKIDYLGSKKSCSIIKSGIDEFDNSKIYIATADVDNSIITSNNTLITMDDKPSRANMQPISNSIWFAKMIDSKKLIMVDEYCNDLLNNYIFSTGFCGLKCVDKYFYYLWTFLLTDVFDVMKNNFCTGTTMQAINNKDTKLIEFVLPDDKTITQFNSIAKPMFKKIYYNNLEIKKLQRLRDTLLPKLMSGEIDVSEVNCDLE